MNGKRTSFLLLIAASCSVFASAVVAADAGSTGPGQDSYITAKVKTELVTDSTTKARHINVTTKDGVVALTGTVDSDAEKEKAEQDARHVKGVVDVINKLDVKQ